MHKKLLTCILLMLSVNSYALGGFYLAPTIAVQSYSADDSERNVVQPKLAIGYGRIYSPFYIAGEIFGGTKPFTTSSFGINDDILKPRETYGFSFLPGWVLDYSTTTLYGRLGLVWSKFSSDSCLHGYQLGAGIQMNLTCHWDIRAEYIFAKYSTLDGIGQPKVNEGDLALVFTL